jgi:hypothetical protein
MEVFFQLGLPDTRGAKWVTASGDGVPNERMIEDFNGGRPIGNAWLVREESDGSLELVVDQSQRLRARRGGRARGASHGGTLPEVSVEPADLDQDVSVLAAAMEKKGGSGELGFSGGDYEQARRTQSAGRALLFLAHLQRQGRLEIVRKVLPHVLAQAPTPELALDAAVSLVANGRLANLSAEWVARGDAASFARKVEALAAEFSRGWKDRDAALLLAERVRTQAPAPGASEPEAKRAAALFLALKPDELRQLPQGQNWLLPGSSSRARSGGLDSSGLPEIEGLPFVGVDEPEPDVPPVESTAAVSGSLAKFLAGKRAAAAALARLLDDHRLLRVLRRSDRSSSFYYREQSREEFLQRAYAELPRPYELGELAATLLDPLLPEAVRSSSDDARKTERVLAWLKEIADLTDEQLAWDYLRRARRTYENDFRTSLSYLVERGGEDTLGKLQEVFLDPAVWQGGSGDLVLTLLEPFLKRLTGDSTAFREKLKAVYKSALEEEQREQAGNFGNSMDEEMKKQYASRFTAQLKQLDQVLKPRGLGDLLAEIAASSNQEEAEALLQLAMPALSKAPRAEAEAQLFQTAAKTKTPATRGQLLMMTMQLGPRNRASRESSAPPKVPDDPATRAALQTLLSDEAPIEAEDFGGEAGRTMADRTAAALVWPRLTPPEMAAWTALFQSVPELAAASLKQHARALAAGQPPPPRPDASRVPAEEVKKLSGQLAALPAGEIFAARRAQKPDQQLALAEHLAKLPQWPPSLIAAHFTITDFQMSPGGSFPEFAVEQWKGRRFDATARQELSETVEKIGREGRGLTATLSGEGPLSGLKLSIGPNKRTFAAEDTAQLGLPGLAGKPPIIALAALYLQSDPAGPQMVAFPIWKDAALAQAWRAENLKPGAAKKPAGSDDSDTGPFGQRNDPVAFEKRLQSILDLKPEARGPFRLTWFVSTVQKNTEP